ncbi:hypothetical protein AVDCRST_MAG82-2863 [uncultured Rubrobacteraceae bacterium]|uniref:Uncharacterized protein n=1 Tax=uncultured Rubrobacteraceae bacterium TaxID=349277 RepID=A0A6J4QG00_9ACTN|nr:hypothetical protein AVDCRST_MAG82-2863 [uncultured Rubrobacteraceae bacterium]
MISELPVRQCAPVLATTERGLWKQDQDFDRCQGFGEHLLSTVGMMPRGRVRRILRSTCRGTFAQYLRQQRRG